MSSQSNSNLWQRFLALPNHSSGKALIVTTLVAIICALVVSSTSVLLSPKKKANIAALRKHQFDQMMSALPGLKGVLSGTDVDTLTTHLVNLEEGVFSHKISFDEYDYIAAGNDPALSKEISAAADTAGIKRMPLYAPVYLLNKNDSLELLVLPVYGSGYQSIIRAWLTLSGDLNTIVAFTISSQAETPGLGSRIENPDWQHLWQQKRLRNEAGDIALSVVRGKSTSANEVDGITGATRTGQGINNMISFWLGDHGFGPFLQNLAAGKTQALSNKTIHLKVAGINP